MELLCDGFIWEGCIWPFSGYVYDLKEYFVSFLLILLFIYVR